MQLTEAIAAGSQLFFSWSVIIEMDFRALDDLERTTHAGMRAACGPVCAEERATIDISTNGRMLMLGHEILADGRIF